MNQPAFLLSVTCIVLGVCGVQGSTMTASLTNRTPFDFDLVSIDKGLGRWVHLPPKNVSSGRIAYWAMEGNALGDNGWMSFDIYWQNSTLIGPNVAKLSYSFYSFVNTCHNEWIYPPHVSLLYMENQRDQLSSDDPKMRLVGQTSTRAGEPLFICQHCSHDPQWMITTNPAC